MAENFSLSKSCLRMLQTDMIFSLRLTHPICMALMIFACTYALQAQTESQDQPPPSNQIKIPWGFQWGESDERLEKALLEAKVNIVERKKIGERVVLVANGFVQPLLQQALFYFQNGGLNEIELQYGEKNWQASQFQDFFEQTRHNVESKYGPGRVITRQKTRENEDVLETIIGYQWTQIAATLQLFLFTAEKGTDSFRLISLHYRGF